MCLLPTILVALIAPPPLVNDMPVAAPLMFRLVSVVVPVALFRVIEVPVAPVAVTLVSVLPAALSSTSLVLPVKVTEVFVPSAR